MENLLCQALRHTGPCLSVELAETLVTRYGLTPEAARQRVSRGAPGINKLKNLKFQNRAVFVYFQEDYRKRIFNKKLNSAILNSKSSYSYALMSILARGGIVSDSTFKVSCGSPVSQKKKVSQESIKKRFLDSKVIEEINIPGVGKCFAIPDLHEKISAGNSENISRIRARVLVEDITLNAVKNWSRNLGLVSYNKVETRSSSHAPPKFGNFNWDLTAPSYLPHLSRYNGEKLIPGFFVCDILLGIKAGKKAVLPFIKKIEDTQAVKNMPHCMYMHMAHSYTQDAFNLLKSKGVIPATPRSLFGKDVADGLSELMNTLSSSEAKGFNEDQYNEIFEKLSFIEGVAGNLRGALFEFIAAEIIKSQDSFSQIEMNKVIVKDRKTLAECDVIAYKRNFKICFIECKGHATNGIVDNKEIKKWLHTRIPRIREYANSHPDWKNLDLEFKFWSTGVIDDEGRRILIKMKKEVKKYSIDFLDGDGVLKEAKSTRNEGLVKTLENHFIEAPS